MIAVGELVNCYDIIGKKYIVDVKNKLKFFLTGIYASDVYGLLALYEALQKTQSHGFMIINTKFLPIVAVLQCQISLLY